VGDIDRAYARDARDPVRKVANVPSITGSSAGGEELVRKIKKLLHHGAGCDRKALITTTDQEPSMIMVNGPISKIERHSAYVAATVVDSEKEPARQQASSGSAQSPASRLATSGRTSATPPQRPVKGTQRCCEPRSWLSDGRKPTRRTAAIKPVGTGSGRPRSCRPAREVSCRSPLPNSWRSDSVCRAPYRRSAHQEPGSVPLRRPGPDAGAARLGTGLRESRPPW
jgi:hypothetical protein